MAKKEAKSSRDGFAETCSSITSGVISFFILILVALFPLIYDKSYINILETKYKCYYVTVIGMMVILLLLSIVLMIIDAMEFKGEHTIRLLARLAPKNWKTTFHAADVAVLVFWAVALISTLQSKYVYESFWGNEGRFTGLFLLTLYVCAYFIISRFWKVKNWCLEVFLISGMILCIIGITDYFQLDVLDFRGSIKPEQSTMFTSTIGNINTYTAYVALLMGFAAAKFATAKTAVKSIWYYICSVITFFAIIMGCSDNAYLALGALFAFLPLVLFKNREGILRYLVLTASLFSAIQAIDFINAKFADMVIGLDSLFRVLANFSGLLYLVIALWVAVAVLFIYNKTHSAVADSPQKLPVRLWTGFLAVAVLAVCFVLYDANAGGHAQRYGALGSYLVFNDSWGTNRGYIWKRSLELYRDFPIMHKLFGYGPDTFGILTTNEIKIEMANVTGQIFDNAHNEYLQYLITVGPIGLAAYVAFLVSAGYRMVKNASRNPYIMGCCFAVLCYGAQAFVNLSLPIATPILWLLLSAGMAGCRSTAETSGRN